MPTFREETGTNHQQSIFIFCFYRQRFPGFGDTSTGPAEATRRPAFKLLTFGRDVSSLPSLRLAENEDDVEVLTPLAANALFALLIEFVKMSCNGC